MKLTKSGFSLVELLIVTVVIAILAAITLVAYTGAQARARDSERISDLHSIGEAVQLYRQKYGNDVQAGSNCGLNGTGNGWFNYTGSTYPASTVSCLIGAGYLDGNSAFVDPSGCTTTTGSSAGAPGPCQKLNGFYEAYMKYSFGSGDTSVTCLFAHLETQDNTTDLTNTTNNPCSAISPTVAASPYYMNYMLVVN